MQSLGPHTGSAACEMDQGTRGRGENTSQQVRTLYAMQGPRAWGSHSKQRGWRGVGWNGLGGEDAQ